MRVDASVPFRVVFNRMETNRDMMELLARAAPKALPAYPDGEAGEFLRNPANRSLALLLGAMTMYGSDTPWEVPHKLHVRLEPMRFTAAALAEVDEGVLRLAMRDLHVDPAKTGKWISQASKVVVGQYGGEASWIWNDYRRIDVSRLIGRLRGIPGIGSVKALMFAFLLGMDWGADIVGWEHFDMPMDEQMLWASRRLGLALPLKSDDPERLVMLHEGLRCAGKHCGPAPRCEMCPVSAGCPRQGA